MTLSLVVPTMNRPDRINSFLKHINKLDVMDYPDEIIVVDQSTIPIKLEAKNMVIPTRIIHQRIASLTKARNTGIESVANEIVLFSDDDVVIPKGVIKKIKDIMQHEQFGLVAGIDLNTKIQSNLISYITLSKSYSKRQIGHMTLSVLGRFPDSFNERTNTEWAMGYFFAVRKSLINDLGIYFDENLKGYAFSEDLDFSVRYIRAIKNLGYEACFNKDVAVYHIGSLEYRQSNLKLVRMFIFYRYYLSTKLFNTKLSILTVTIHNLFVAIHRLFKLDKLFYLYAWYTLLSLVNIKQISNGNFPLFRDGENI